MNTDKKSANKPDSHSQTHHMNEWVFARERPDICKDIALSHDNPTLCGAAALKCVYSFAVSYTVFRYSMCGSEILSIVSQISCLGLLIQIIIVLRIVVILDIPGPFREQLFVFYTFY